MSDDHVIRRRKAKVCERWRVMDHADKAYFRSYRGRYPQDGYRVGETNPFREPTNRRPPPLRGNNC